MRRALELAHVMRRRGLPKAELEADHEALVFLAGLELDTQPPSYDSSLEGVLCGGVEGFLWEVIHGEV